MSNADATRLMRAQIRVHEGHRVVAEQRIRIDRLHLLGRDTKQERDLLRTFETTLTLFEAELERVTAETAK